jgi:hypothetical protein
MEEILASIRRIISDDTDDNADDKTRAADTAAEDDVEAANAEFDAGEDEADEDVLELTEVIDEDDADTVDPDFDFDNIPVDDEPEAAPSADVEFVDIEANASPAAFDRPSATDMRAPADAETKGLLSDETDHSVAAAFGKLASTLLARDGTTRTLEELVQEMLRPMLKAWLDQNLPTVVEDLVRQEIERVSRRGGR